MCPTRVPSPRQDTRSATNWLDGAPRLGEARGIESEPLARAAQPSLTNQVVARGDAASFTLVYGCHQQALYRYCWSILRHREDAQDALQSTMERAYAALQRERREIEWRPWLFRIARNEAVSILRRRRETEALPETAAPGGDLDEHVVAREQLRALRGDLANLSERQHAALVLRAVNGLDHREIAELLGCSPAAVKQAICEARTALLKCREGRDMACGEVRRALSDGDGRRLRGHRLRSHLRACIGCRRFQAELEERERRLALPPLAAALQQLLTGAGSATGAWQALTVGGVAQMLAAKLALTAAVIVMAAGGARVAERGAHPAAPAAGTRIAEPVAHASPVASVAPTSHHRTPTPTVRKRPATLEPRERAAPAARTGGAPMPADAPAPAPGPTVHGSPSAAQHPAPAAQSASRTELPAPAELDKPAGGSEPPAGGGQPAGATPAGRPENRAPRDRGRPDVPTNPPPQSRADAKPPGAPETSRGPDNARQPVGGTPSETPGGAATDRARGPGDAAPAGGERRPDGPAPGAGPSAGATPGKEQRSGHPQAW